MRVYLLVFVSVFFLLIGPANTHAATIIYDDFSEPTLNLSKWNETTDSTFPDEHSVNTTEQTYHTAQIQPGDSALHLIMTKGLANETVEFDVIYVSGSGNHLSNFGFAPYGSVSWCSGNCYIGYWNAPGLWGSQTGTYHVTIDFDLVSERANVSVKRPDETYWTSIADLSVTSPPYYLFVQTSTGHNGIMHFDIDNVEIVTEEPEPPEPECNCSELEKRITELEERVELIETAIQNIQDAIDLIWETLDSLTPPILDYFFNVPNGIRRSMVCGYMEDNNLTQHEALGLSCELKETGKGKSSACRCEKA